MTIGWILRVGVINRGIGMADSYLAVVTMLHEFCHAQACRLLRVKVAGVDIDPGHLYIETTSRMKERFVALFPCVFDSLFILYYTKGSLRVLMLKLWFRILTRLFPTYVLQELRNIRHV